MSFDRPRPRPGVVRELIYLCVLFFVFMQAGLLASRSRWTERAKAGVKKWIPDYRIVWSAAGRANNEPLEHPIPRLMAQAEDNFRNMLSRQSRTLKDAVAEYRRRYKMDPPRGFEDWWDFAQKYNFKMLDEFDSLMEDMAPFRELSGEEVRRRAVQVGRLPSIDIVRLTDGKAWPINLQKEGFVDTEVSARAHGWRRMIEKFQHKLPDMDFPINAKAEGRVLVPWEHRMYPNMTQQDSSIGIKAMLGDNFVADWRGDGNVWEQFRRVCSPDSQARRLFGSLRVQGPDIRPINHFDKSGLPSGPGEDFVFPHGTDYEFDFCSNPWAHYQQGHFFSDWRTIPVLYPVFSPARAPGYLDVRIPSHYYHQASQHYTYGWDPVNLVQKDVDDMEVDWENKTDLIFWRGATTGGGSSPPGFAAQYQRHRFVRMSSDMSEDNNKTVVFADPPGSEKYTVAKVPIKNLNEEIMDVAFVRATGYANFPGGRAAMHKLHRFAQSVPLGEHWQYKYLIDFDGMGYSGRFFAFLASDSVPVKATVYSEFFSDWIQPWLHFIPLSQSYKEVYNIHAFFSGPSPSMLKAINSSVLYNEEEANAVVENDRRLRRIARAGRQWKQTIGRKIDMEVFAYRLSLEWARLWHDDRDAWSYKG